MNSPEKLKTFFALTLALRLLLPVASRLRLPEPVMIPGMSDKGVEYVWQEEYAIKMTEVQPPQLIYIFPINKEQL
jgi:hypothetical protein